MDVIRIGDACEILNGYAFKSDQYVMDGIRVIRIANVQKGYIEDNTPAFYPTDSTGLERYMLEEGDLLMSLTGNVGRVAILERQFLPAALNQRVACLRLKTDKILKGYLFHILNSDFFEIPLYTKEKQIEIEEILSKIRAIISSRKSELQKLDELIKARFVEMFGDPDLNPMGWEESLLSDKLNVLGGYAFKSDEFDEDTGIPVLRIGNINAGYFRPVNMVYWHEDDSLERYAMYPGDLVMSLTGTVGKDDYGNVCILGNDYDKYYLNQRNAKLEIKEGIDKLYLSEILKFDTIKKRLTGISRGVRQANIANKDIMNLRLPIPPMKLQEQFAVFVAQVDKSKVAVHAALDKAQLLFDSLMQQYFG